MTLFTHEFWIENELKKVRSPNRRAILRRIFFGEGGWEKFLTIMRTRKGADEFRTGEWQATIPKYSKAELELKRRPCFYGCGNTLPPEFTDWGELFEDFIPICEKCLPKIKNNQKQNMENQSAENKVAAVAAINPSTEQADNSPQAGLTLDEMVAQWPNLNNKAKLRLGECIVSKTRERMKNEVAELEAKVKELKAELGEKATVTNGRRRGRPPKVKK